MLFSTVAPALNVMWKRKYSQIDDNIETTVTTEEKCIDFNLMLVLRI
jgi:hypothetical protein